MTQRCRQKTGVRQSQYAESIKHDAS